MISIRYAFQRLKVKGQGSDFSAPPAYIRASTTELAADGAVWGRSVERKDEQNRARGSVWYSLEGSENRTELKAVRRGKVRTELGSELRGESW